MKRFIVALLTIGAFTSCEREITVVDPAALDDRNIYIRAYKYFDGNIADTSTVYQINGDLIKLSHAYITLSGAEFVSVDEKDTTHTDNDLTAIDLLATSEVKLAQLPRGSYNGRLNYHIGLDSARAYAAPETLEETNPLVKGHLWNGPATGHSFFQLEGRVFDLNDSLFTAPTSTFTWRIASEDMVIERSEKRNFNVAANKDVFFVIDLDIEKLFLGLQPSSTPEIYSDPGDADDYNKAQILSDNLKSEFVFKL
ncbi:MAG TPA: hypothetical protein DIT65_08000 [Cryomorphaceae bacterium]|nr:hypothetical protein [Cryomorphaceae bacterium]|tara:strand:+ start:1669 stop:2430 length:762 start_codon:yes stop_codon:yes gene_type:complete